jgi:hypothetical protein
MLPLVRKIRPVLGFASTVVPVTGISRIAFLPVEIGVNPSRFGGVVILNQVMSLLPLPLRGKPQRPQRTGELGRLAGELPEFGSRHEDQAVKAATASSIVAQFVTDTIGVPLRMRPTSPAMTPPGPNSMKRVQCR